MAAVYKSLSKKSGDKVSDETNGTKDASRKNKQRVLVLSSRGVTYRYATLVFRSLSPLSAQPLTVALQTQTSPE